MLLLFSKGNIHCCQEIRNFVIQYNIKQQQIAVLAVKYNPCHPGWEEGAGMGVNMTRVIPGGQEGGWGVIQYNIKQQQIAVLAGLLFINNTGIKLALS